MRRITVSTLAILAGLATPITATAQQSVTRQGDETAGEMAIRIAVCDGSGIENARFADGGGTLRVSCVDGVAGLEGGLGSGPAIAAGAIVLVVVAAASGGSSSSPSTN